MTAACNADVDYEGEVNTIQSDSNKDVRRNSVVSVRVTGAYIDREPGTSRSTFVRYNISCVDSAGRR